MKILRTPEEMKAWRRTISADVGFVPTMGALHQGHEELLKRARPECDVLVLSIFVNPTQFNDPKDFEKYPSTWEADVELARKNKVDVIFAPTKDVMYPDGYRFKVIENEFSHLLCGRDRPGHFDGVLSVVIKLFNVVDPQKAYFGEKDYQQLSLIRDMAKAFFMNVEIVPVPTVREKSGLAMSSRNVRLSPKEREEIAPKIFKRITEARSAEEARKNLESDGLQIDYVTDLNGRRFVAVRLGEVRLIDNVQI